MREPLLTVEELATWIGKSSKAIYDLRYRGEPGALPLSIEIGGALRYDPADVREWLNERREQARREQTARVEDIRTKDLETRTRPLQQIRATAGKTKARISFIPIPVKENQ